MKFLIVLLALVSVNANSYDCEDEISKAYYRGYMCRYCEGLKKIADIGLYDFKEQWEKNCKGINYCEGEG